MRTTVPTDILLVFALPSEAGQAFKDLEGQTLFTGVGKINAAYALTRQLSRHRPRLVVSLGTAGSPVHPTHALVECTELVQRDMDARGLGFEHGTTPMDTLPAVLTLPRRLPDLPAVRCGSGDSFVTERDRHDCEVVDMEAYALAKVCAREGVDLLVVKYVTDGGDLTADRDWVANLPRAAAAFRRLYDRLTSVEAQ